MEIVKNHHENRLDDKISQVRSRNFWTSVEEFQNLVKEIIVEPHLLEYIVKNYGEYKRKSVLYLESFAKS